MQKTSLFPTRSVWSTRQARLLRSSKARDRRGLSRAGVGAWALALALLVLPLAVLHPAGQALAQGSLFDKAKDLLKSGEGETAGGLSATSLSAAEIGDGLREALRVGTERVVGQLGQTDGFNADPDIHIPLPDSLQKVQSALQAVGMSDLADEVELRLNRAAEQATPQAKQIFWDAISEMSVEDAEGILNGPDDAATRYFQDKMSAPLSDAMRPVIDDSLADVGAIAAYDNMMEQYKTIPFVPDAKADLTDYTLAQALDGLFTYVAREEAAIRSDPAKRSTEILQKVFGE